MNAFKTIFFNKTNVKIFLFWDIRDKSAEKIIFSELRYKRIDRNFRKLFFDFGLSMPALFASVNWIRFQYINSYPLKTNLYIAYLTFFSKNSRVRHLIPFIVFILVPLFIYSLLINIDSNFTSYFFIPNTFILVISVVLSYTFYFSKRLLS